MKRRRYASIGLVLVALSVLGSAQAPAPAVQQPESTSPSSPGGEQVTIAEAESTTPAVPPAAVPPSETLGWMFTFGIIANYIMRKMKESSKFAWLHTGAGKINIGFAAFLAAISALGIHTEFDSAEGSLLITGLSATSVVKFGGEWVRQWALQQWTYQTMRDTV